MSLSERLNAEGPKRILSIDGGGIRGAATIGFLQRIEQLLRERHQNEKLVLADYFDLIGGTSTGAIIAALLARGWTAQYVKEKYLKLGEKVFSTKAPLLKKTKFGFDAKALEAELENEFEDLTLGDSKIKTGLCIVVKRADTGSTWPLINHPKNPYPSNLGFLIRDVLRASTAAPTYFQPQLIDVGGGEVGAFIDGGVSVANSPALTLFQVATLQGFPFKWSKSEENLMLVSLGTGRWKARQNPLEVSNDKIWKWASEVPQLMMRDSTLHNHLMLQYMSDSPTNSVIDAQIGDMSGDFLTDKPLLHYLRYNVTLEKNELQALGLTAAKGFDVESLREMSAGENVKALTLLGEKAANVNDAVSPSHFCECFNLVTSNED